VAEVTTTSMEAYNYYLRGVDEYDKFYYDDSRRFLERAVAIDSTFAMAYIYLASAYGYLRDRVSRDDMYERAMRYAEHATERERLHIASRYATVIEDDQEKKRRLLQELVRKYPKEKRAYIRLAMDARDEDHHQEAIDYLQKALVLDPTFAPALNMLGYEHLYARNYDEALECLERYAAASPGDANPFDSMGEVYFDMGELEQSVDKYREAVEVKPDFFGAIRNVAYVYGVMGEYDSAMVWINRYLDTVPTPGLRLMGYGWRSLFLFLTGQVDAAFADIGRWEEILKSNSRYPTSAHWYLKGCYLYGTGRYAEAERAFEEWHDALVRLYPERPQTNEGWSSTHRALVYARWGRVDDAMAAIARADSMQPELDTDQARSSFFLIQAEVLLAAGRVNDAIELVGDSLRMHIPPMANEARVLIHNFPLEGDVLARAYVAKGDLNSAAAEYQHLIEFDPDGNNRRLRNPVYCYRLGKVYERMGRPADAAEQYRHFLHYWRDADKNLDPYVDAHTRLSALEGTLDRASE
jgi:tetratricopeptide (TPR) repeat protein